MMKFFNKIKPGHSEHAGKQQLLEDLLEKALINEDFRKRIMIDPESALKIYPLSDNEFDTMIVGTHLIQHIIQINEGKKGDSDDKICLLESHFRRATEGDIQRLDRDVSPKVVRIVEEWNDIRPIITNLGRITPTFSFCDDDYILPQKKGKVLLCIINVKCNHLQETLEQTKERDTLLNLNDLRGIIPVLEELKQRGICETCGCKLGKLDMIVASESKVDDALKHR